VIYGRFGIACAFDLVRITVAIFAGGRGVFPGLAGLGMGRMCVGGLSVGVALGAAHLLRRVFMHQALYVFVAVHACEHAAVD